MNQTLRNIGSYSIGIAAILGIVGIFIVQVFPFSVVTPVIPWATGIIWLIPVKTFFFSEERLMTSCKKDYGLDRIKYSVMPREESTKEMLTYAQENLPKDESWVAQISTQKGFYYAGHFPWRQYGPSMVYESFIWKCETQEDAQYHIQFFQANSEVNGNQLKSYFIEEKPNQ